MKVYKFLKTKKLLLLNFLLVLYIATNLIGGERGLISFYEKKHIQEKLKAKEEKIIKELSEYEKRNKLLSTKIDLDYIDMVYREKLKFGKKNEIIIKN